MVDAAIAAGNQEIAQRLTETVATANLNNAENRIKVLMRVMRCLAEYIPPMPIDCGDKYDLIILDARQAATSFEKLRNAAPCGQALHEYLDGKQTIKP